MAEKNEIIDYIRNEISLLQTKLDELHLQAKMAEMEVRERIQPEIERLETRLENSRKSLESLSVVSQEAFDEARKGLEGAVKEMKQGFESALDKLRSHK